MKITIANEKKEEELKFPCLMISPHTDSNFSFVILVNSENGNFYNAMNLMTGEFANNWIKDCYKPFNGEITLSNN